MIYKRYLAMIMVLAIMSFEPAAAMQIGSENEYSDINSNNVFEKINKTKTSYGIVKNKLDCNIHGRNDRFLNMNSVKIKSFKKFSKNPHHTHLLHKFKHSFIIKKTNLTTDENIHENKSESNEKHLSDLNQQFSNDKSNIDTFQSEASINKTQNSNIIENKTEYVDFGLNNRSMNNSAEISNFTNITNETPKINNTTNKSLNSTENNTNLNNTQNLTNNTTISSNAEESTKDKVCDTLLAVGYLSAAIAAGCALNPDPVASKVIGVIAVGVAVVSFVAYICIKWIW